MAGHAPLVALTEGERVVASARVGTEAHGELLTVFEDALARTATLIVAALRGLRPMAEPCPKCRRRPSPSEASPATPPAGCSRSSAGASTGCATASPIGGSAGAVSTGRT